MVRAGGHGDGEAAPLNVFGKAVMGDSRVMQEKKTKYSAR